MMADQTSRNAAERRENALSDLTRNGMNFQNEKMKESILYYFIILVFFIPQIWSERKIHFFFSLEIWSDMKVYFLHLANLVKT